MSFLYLSAILPLLLLSIGVVKEIHQVLIHLRLILFHNGQVIAPYPCTQAHHFFCVHGIRTDDASFHERRVNQRGGSTDLIFFPSHGSLRQDDATVTLIEG